MRVKEQGTACSRMFHDIAKRALEEQYLAYSLWVAAREGRRATSTVFSTYIDARHAVLRIGKLHIGQANSDDQDVKSLREALLHSCCHTTERCPHLAVPKWVASALTTGRPPACQCTARPSIVVRTHAVRWHARSVKEDCHETRLTPEPTQDRQRRGPRPARAHHRRRPSRQPHPPHQPARHAPGRPRTEV